MWNNLQNNFGYTVVDVTTLTRKWKQKEEIKEQKEEIKRKGRKKENRNITNEAYLT